MDKYNIPTHAEGQTFTSLQLSNSSFNGHSFSDCTFIQCDFTQSSFEEAGIWGCTFTACNLSLITLKQCRMQNVLFNDCKLVGVDFSRCDTALLFSINAHKSSFQYCNFAALPMQETSFKECVIHNCKFIDTLLQKSSFVASDFAGTTFNNCDLREAHFERAFNYCINPCGNKITKATFSFPECIGIIKALDITILD